MTSMIRAILMALVLSATPALATEIPWQSTWGDAQFAQAAREHKLVLLDLHAVWCHWCHVMDSTTYADPAIQALLAKHFIPVSIDADSDPALTSRYGDWGWPATIVLAADGTEIVKRRGYIAPAQMRSLLEAIIADPTPGPSVNAALAIPTTTQSNLGQPQRASLEQAFQKMYDETNAGWGTEHKYVDAAAIELSFAQLDAGDQTAIHKIRRTLDANLNLIDPVWGGVYQYSDHIDWKSPHFEKLLSFQADDLREYSEAYARWHRPSDLQAAQKIYGYMKERLAAPDGGFFVSQDADVSKQVNGRDFYSRTDAQRRAIGMPHIDTHEYARETGWAIQALCRYYDVTSTQEALELAERAAQWALANRALPGGGFRHGAPEATGNPSVGGPFLDDNVSMSTALLDLYRSTGRRDYLQAAINTLQFIDHTLRDPKAGYDSSVPPANGRGVFREPVREVSQNAMLVRTANMVHHYSADDRAQQIARHAMRYLVGYAAAAADSYHPEILLADRELSAEPIHITVVGAKTDPSAQALHAAALRYPTDYLQVDWWDRREGKLPNPNITYPVLARAAAFACTANACSTPVYDASELEQRVHSIMN